MKPTSTGYPEAQVWKGYDHDGVKDGRIGDMESVRDHNGTLWCCWKAETFRERLSFLIFGKAWIGIMAQRQPPVSCVVSRKL